MEINFQPDDNDLAHALSAFGFKQRVVTFTPLLSRCGQEEGTGAVRLRLIARLDLASGTPLVIKFQSLKPSLVSQLERQSSFSEFLRAGGIPCARRWQVEGSFSYQTQAQGLPVVITLEDFEPGELTVLDEQMIRRIGALMARAHRLSESASYQVYAPTIFDVTGKNDIALFSVFEGLAPLVPTSLLTLYQKVQTACQFWLSRIKEGLRHYPRIAVQGDFSINNLFDNQHGLGLFDFNNCGDVHALSDLVLEGLLLSREMEAVCPLTPQVAERLFSCFLEGYQEDRRFTEEEIRIMVDIYAFANCLYMMQVKWGEDSLQKLLEKGERDRAAALLQYMMAQISDNKVPGLTG